MALAQDALRPSVALCGSAALADRMSARYYPRLATASALPMRQQAVGCAKHSGAMRRVRPMARNLNATTLHLKQRHARLSNKGWPLFFNSFSRESLHPHKFFKIALYTACENISSEQFEGEWDMDFLLSHWHCILPAIAILIGLLLMRGNRPASSKDDDRQG